MAEGFFRPDQLQIPGLAQDAVCAAMVRVLPRTLLGMVRHEFGKAVEAGVAFPVTVPLDGGGSGFAIDASGHVLTNHHLVASEVANHGRAAGAIGVEARWGDVVGLFSRAAGDGPRNAFEYGHLSRVQVATRLAIEGLALAWPGAPPPGGA